MRIRRFGRLWATLSPPSAASRSMYSGRLPRPVCMTTCLVTDLGLISYADASALQQRLAAARKAGVIDDVFLLCEHPHVITLGRNASRANLLASEDVLRQKGVELHSTNRGGDIPYHGPGQIVGYPIVNLANIKRDVGW